ncbi:CaiB/BaiF CoA-transferase family protein [Janibacter alkaliphilus]
MTADHPGPDPDRGLDPGVDTGVGPGGRAPARPLAGIRVIELVGIGPAPYACLLMAELGAEVIRVDRPGGAGPLAAGTGLGRSRPSVAVDLKHPDGIATVRRLAAEADVLVEGLRPGVTERLGLGPEELHAANPVLVYARMTGWGQEGPLAQEVGHDITYAAVAGALSLAGPAERPVPPANLLADFGGGSLFLVVGVLAALLERQRTGQGQVVDAAMVDGVSSLATMIHGLRGIGLWQDERQANLLDGGAPFYDTYRCADGRFVAVGALEPQFYAALLDGLGVSFAHEQHDPAGFAEQRRVFTEAFTSRTRDEWAAHFAGSDACVAPVLDLGEAPEHPQARARDAFADLGGAVTPRVAPRFSTGPPPQPTPERPAGADTRSQLLGHGFSEAEVEALLASGAIAQTDPD